MSAIPGIVYVPAFLPDPEPLLRWALQSVPWDERIKARKTASYGVPYDYAGLVYEPRPFPPELDAVRLATEAHTGHEANNCLLNYYPDGHSRMGWHADATDRVIGGVAIVSLGATRPLRFRRTAQLDDRLDYVLAPGSLLFLPREVHLTWQHALPRVSRPEPRISLTFRAVSATCRLPEPLLSFEDLDLLDTLRATLVEQGIVTPTEIQERALPELLARRSVVGVAETGSGKTLTYVLPALQLTKTLETLDAPITENGQPRVLVVVPTRELGDQVLRVFKAFTHATRVRVRGAFGGGARAVAKRAVSGPVDILVGSPGRLGQLLAGGELRMTDVRMLVLDEADQLLDMGFLPEVGKLVEAAPAHRQVALFSATLPAPVEAFVAQIFRRPPVLVKTKGSHHVVASLTTVNRRVVDGDRATVLRDVLRTPVEGGTILFANTRDQCDRLFRELTEAGHRCVVYRGEMDPVERRTNLREFREGAVKLLVATDLGARGLDVVDVDRVINVHLPQELANYLHRVGRTARAGRRGVVINFVTDRDAKLVERLGKVATPAR